MRNFKSIAMIATLAVSTLAVAATDATGTLTFTNNAANNLSITGDADIVRNFVGTGTAGTSDLLTDVAGGTLVWDTEQETAGVETTYQITVRLDKALEGFTGKVSLAGGNSNVVLGTATNADSAAVLMSSIQRYTSGSGALTYNFEQLNTHGFDNENVTVTYSLIAE